MLDTVLLQMSNGGNQQFRGENVDQAEVLLRLVWDSDDLDPTTREISTSAFAKRDLKGTECGLSVDREKIAVKSVILETARRQKYKADCNPDLGLNRNSALLAKAVTKQICEQVFDDDQVKMFAVISTPIKAEGNVLENPAHAEVINISGRTKGSDFNKLRLKLQPLFSVPLPIDEVLP